MYLEKDEVILKQVQPGKKLLVPWFFEKTLRYSLSTLLMVCTLLFFGNTIGVLKDMPTNKEKTVMESSTAIIDKPGSHELKHPFEMIVDNWQYGVIIGGLSFILIQIYLIFLRKTYIYTVTNKRCVFQGGLLKKIERSVSHKKITDVQRSQNILEQILGIENIQVFTPGTASMAFGNRQPQAELNFDGLVDGDELAGMINQCVQDID